ncbi:MAG: ornithine carbamoyltransferase [Candidatus Diapherotrites archaeon]|nr:ornithine carbamoyltransferase [Candidatus Diapherotrites archaeon]
MPPVKVPKELHALHGRSFLSDQDLSAEETLHVLEFTRALKEAQKKGIPHRLLEGKTLAMLFLKPSTRTRVSFETGMFQLGGHAINLTTDATQLKRGEPLSDTARVLSKYADAIMARVYGHDQVQEIQKNSSVPVINGLSNYLHPCQILSDLFTLYETKGKLKGLHMAYFGRPNNVSNSLLLGCTKMGVHITLYTPSRFNEEPLVWKEALQNARKTHSQMRIAHSIDKSIEEMDFLYTDSWVSMHQHEPQTWIFKRFKEFQVNDELIKKCKPGIKVLHDLPAKREWEITSSVLDGKQSLAWEQAENRLHAQKALMACML